MLFKKLNVVLLVMVGQNLPFPHIPVYVLVVGRYVMFMFSETLCTCSQKTSESLFYFYFLGTQTNAADMVTRSA